MRKLHSSYYVKRKKTDKKIGKITVNWINDEHANLTTPREKEEIQEVIKE